MEAENATRVGTPLPGDWDPPSPRAPPSPGSGQRLEVEALTNPNGAGADVLRRFLSGAFLPPYLPGEPRALGARLAALRVAPRILALLERIYGVERWDAATYRRRVLEGAFGTWRPGSQVGFSREGTQVRATVCPLRELAARDPRACEMCRFVQQDLARLALPQSGEARFDRLLTRGDDACEMTLTWGKASRTTPSGITENDHGRD